MGDGTRTWLRWIVPPFDEAVPAEFYRNIGKLRTIYLPAVIAFNWLSWINRGSMHADPEFWLHIQLGSSAVFGLALLISLAIWRSSLALGTLRSLTIACVLLEIAGAVVMTWANGIVSSHMLAWLIIMVVLYRSVFDMRIGLLAFGAIAVGMWLAVIGQIAGWWDAEPIREAGEPLSAMYRTSARQLVAVGSVTFALTVGLVMASWVVARLRHKEEAVRLLRQTLAAVEPSKVGRHTGRTLRGTYTLGPLIGVGGMGEVYAGHHERTQRPLAIKLVHAHLLGSNELLARLRREANIAGALGSAHIVEVLDVDEDDGQPFLVMELLEGHDLRERIATRGPLPFAEVGRVVSQVAVGLKSAHDAGIVHRDLKPANVFLAVDGEREVAKILDFGVSKIQGAATVLTQEVALLGTPAFMAPEQIMEGGAQVSPRSDIYALAAVSYNALTGRHPHAADAVPQLLMKVLRREPLDVAELRPDVPHGVRAVLAIGLAKRPDQRFETALELADALERALSGAADAEIERRAAGVVRGVPPIVEHELPSSAAAGDTMTAK